MGGPPVTVAESARPVFGAGWGDDDRIIFGTQGGGLFRVPGGGGEPEVLTTPDVEQGEVHHVQPFIIPGRGAVVFVTSSQTPRSDGQLAVLDLDTAEIKRLGLSGVSPRYVSTGHLVYAAEDGSVRAVPFDAATLEVTGSPVPLLEDVVVTGRDGVGTPLAEIAGTAWYPRYSPDGTRLAFVAATTEGADVWVLDLERGTRTRLTSEGLNRYYPVWSPDGSLLAFSDGAGATIRVLLASADGSGEPEILLDRNERQFPTSWFADGDVLALHTQHPETERDLYMLPMDGDLVPEPFLATRFQERAPRFSPDGRWVAYVSDESGRDEVYVRPYPGPGGQVIVSTGGGEEMVWGPDGSELFYRNDDQLMVVAVTTGENFSAGASVPLFAAPFAPDNSGGGAGSPNYDISPDGQQFVFIEQESPVDVAGVAEISVVLNWHQELLDRVPTN